MQGLLRAPEATLGELDIATTPLPAAWHDARHGAFNGQAQPATPAAAP